MCLKNILLVCSSRWHYLLIPKVEYLPSGNRNLIISMILPPPGYNVDQLPAMGEEVEETLRPYWNIDPENEDTSHLILTKMAGRFPGSFVTASQTSLFGRGLSGGRTIDVEITGPELTRLISIGGQILGAVQQHFPEGTQARPRPSLDTESLKSEYIATRNRPIFMTTTTTVFGLSPLVFFPGAGSELYRGLGAVVLGGLLVSTFFTLILVPTLFSLMIDLKALFVGKPSASEL